MTCAHTHDPRQTGQCRGGQTVRAQGPHHAAPRWLSQLLKLASEPAPELAPEPAPRGRWHQALALLATAFEEALLLDADNLALRVRRPLPSVAGAASCQACCGSGSVL